MDTATRDLTSTWLTTLSRRCHAQFDRRNMAVRRSRTVHAVAWTEGIGGVELPVPACRVGVTGWDVESLRPVNEGVTCGRCLRTIKRSELPTDAELRGGQLALDVA